MSSPSSLIGAIDQGTGSSRFLLFDEDLNLVDKHQVDVQAIYQREGWFEQDPDVLYQSVLTCLEKVGGALRSRDLDRLRGIGITNQRETTILWDKNTGACLSNALVWCDGRTADLATKLIGKRTKDQLRSLCGLPIHTYFSALKIKWLMENVKEVKDAINDGRCLFGTVDSWLIWNLTGGCDKGGVHVTDVTNASRTMLMNIKTLSWDTYLCKFFGIPMSILPTIKSSSEIYGYIADGVLKGIPICGCLGDQQAALVGQQCFKRGEAKSTYGTGYFSLYNTGDEIVHSRSGMLTTVAYQLGPTHTPTYALEGSVSDAGQSVKWLKDSLQLFEETSDIEHLAKSEATTGDVYFVPAFSGLYAPYWETDARGLIVGITNYTNKAHLCRATLEAVCFQSREIVQCMNKDSSKGKLEMVFVDGGMTRNDFLLQLLANILGIPVVRPHFPEMTVRGAAIAAGLAVRIWSSPDSLPKLESDIFTSQISEAERDHQYERWMKAVNRCRKWTGRDVRRNKMRSIAQLWISFGTGLLTGALLGVALYMALSRRF